MNFKNEYTQQLYTGDTMNYEESFYLELEKIGATVKSFLGSLATYGAKGKNTYQQTGKKLQLGSKEMRDRRDKNIWTSSKDLDVMPFSEISILGKKQLAPPQIEMIDDTIFTNKEKYKQQMDPSLVSIGGAGTFPSPALSGRAAKDFTNKMKAQSPMAALQGRTNPITKKDVQMQHDAPTGKIKIDRGMSQVMWPLIAKFRPPNTPEEKRTLMAYLLRHEMDERRLLKGGGKAAVSSHVRPTIYVNDNNFLHSMIRDTKKGSAEMQGVNYLKKVLLSGRALEYRQLQRILPEALGAHIPDQNPNKGALIKEVVDMFNPTQPIEQFGSKKVPAWAKRALDRWSRANPDKIKLFPKGDTGLSMKEMFTTGIYDPRRK